MQTTRPAAVAGQFYPGETQALRDAVSTLLCSAPADVGPVKVLVAPHAGYIYSGQLAARAYAHLAPQAATIRRVVLLGPAHRVGFAGIACSSADRFRTPLGDIPLDQEALRDIAALPAVLTLDEAHAREHSLEVHLPFLQELLDSFTLVPLLVGQASAEEVCDVLEALWGGPETLVVISTDLSHFHDYDTARRIDQDTARLIEQLQPQLRGEQACGARPLNGLMLMLRNKQLELERLGIMNSGDTAGDRARVVGYGAWLARPGA